METQKKIEEIEKKLEDISTFAPALNKNMAGLYIHIPFCRSRCIYCDFYSTTLVGMQERYVDALIEELRLRKDYLGGEQINTIYLGGGTPSQLSCDNIARLFRHLPVAEAGSNGEITVECNPDDVDDHLAETLHSVGVNRVSMGAQSFSDDRLRFLRRRHNAGQVKEAVETLRHNGIANISIDLMFGFPGETLEDWIADIDEALKLNVKHISAYSLMYEEGTPLYKMLESGKVKEIDEELSRQMYYTLVDKLESAGYEHYEISNFARPGHVALHNSSYWNGTPYLGIGAGAHSYDRKSRQWNVADIAIYINKVEKGEIPFTREVIDERTRYNDMITTALRTRQGLSLEECGTYREYLLENARQSIDNGLLTISDGFARLTRKGLYVSDDVMSDLIAIV